MVGKKKRRRRAEQTVEAIFFGRPSYRRAVAQSNLDDALKHTKAVLKKAQLKPR